MILRHRHVPAYSFGIGILLCAGYATEAAEHPPVKIRLSGDAPVATAGQDYDGLIEIEVGRDGAVGNVEAYGKGWQVISVGSVGLQGLAPRGILRVPFRAIPTDPDMPITISLTFDGRRVSRTYKVGPQAAAHRWKARPALRVVVGEPDQPRVTAGDPVTLHFKGRIAYDRPVALDNQNTPSEETVRVGVDHMWVEILDDDDISTETVWAGYTDRNGYFDTGEFQWDDCDISGCDDPDLYIRWECDNDIVNVQDANDILEEDWSWSTEADTIDDFTGSFHDFGTLMPLDGGQMPILHIHNSIIRAHRFVEFKSGSGIDVDHVDVQWPASEEGSGASHNGFFDELYIAPSRQWHEDSQTHEFGHHLLDNHGLNTGGTDYCNSICDFDDGCSHCMWCEETALDAWNEGWPNWLADVVTRDYPVSYTFSDGTPYTALKPRDQETIRKCEEDNTFHDPLRTEGFLGALLRDIEDSASDPAPNDFTTLKVVERRDCLSLGTDEIFALTIGFEPTTPAAFINAFLASYPELTPRLFVTAHNISTEYSDLFLPDTQPPGVVEEVRSTTHPMGQGGPSPCIVLGWDTPSDDVQGAHAYSIAWGPAGAEPDEIGIDVFGSCVDVAMEAQGLGSYYISIKARGWNEGEWSNGWGVFGPFTVTDCNSNGIVDICEVSCSPSSVFDDLACNVSSAFCSNQPACGMAQDCNDNKIPDGCDIAGGESEDCNENSVPDECESIFHWKNGTGTWNTAANWVEESLVTNGSSVCIQDADEQATVTYTNGITSLAVLACDENLNLAAGFNQLPQFILNAPSWVRGNLTLSTVNSTLVVNNRLDIDGLLTWSNGTRLEGAGTTYARGGLLIPSGIGNLEAHDLVLESGTTNISRGRIDFPGASTLTIRPGAVFEHQSGSGVVNGGSTTTLFRNEGTFIKSVSTATSGISSRVENAGLVHVQAGTLQIFNYTSDNTGAFLADPGTSLQFVGAGHEFQPSSSITGELVRFLTGRSGTNNFRGTYDVSVSTIVQNNLTFVAGANIVNYGPSFSVSGSVTFDAVAGRAIHFDSISGGMIHFNSGDPIVAEVMTVSGGTGLFDGPSSLTVNGLLTYGGGASIRGPGVLNVNGEMAITASSNSRFFSNRTLNNIGTVTSNGGFEAQGTTVVNNLAGAVWDIRADTGIVVGGTATPFNNAGLLVKTAGAGAARISATFNNTGTVEARVGTLEFRHPFIQTAGEMLLNGGNIGTYGSPLPPAPRMDGGRLRGNGTVGTGLNNVGGIVEPGLSAGRIIVNGAYTQGASGRLHIEIGGLTPITKFDQLNVTGAATLLGHIDVSLINGFIPSVGDTFDVVTFASRVGGPPVVAIEPLPSAIEMLVHLLPTSVRLEFAARAASADCNGDTDIDGADFAAFWTCVGGPALSADPPPVATECRCADMDLDDEVDLRDYAMFQNFFSP